ncbi:MAG TPA: hypothetical protein VIK63_02075, partial [Haloplasmataceae bacterium]
ECDNMKKEAWEKFIGSGSIDDYLKYKGKQKDYLNEMGTEVVIRSKDKGGKRDQNNRRDRS